MFLWHRTRKEGLFLSGHMAGMTGAEKGSENERIVSETGRAELFRD
jgi:hypothetical protein